jgi:hypothetical protein
MAGFVQLGLDVEAIIACAYPSFGFGRRKSTRQYFLTSAFFSRRCWCCAGANVCQHHQQLK